MEILWGCLDAINFMRSTIATSGCSRVIFVRLTCVLFKIQCLVLLLSSLQPAALGMYAFERFFFFLIVFASVAVFLPLKVCAQNETSQVPSCISNYAQLKQALFANHTGNKERLLYAFLPTNSPIPNYVWVYYFHNVSTEWKNVLACPSSSNLARCPTIEDGTKGDTSYHILVWADSPLLRNVDIPLLKFLSYNSILQYLDKFACVQLVIPPFCSSVDTQMEIDMLKFATSYVSY